VEADSDNGLQAGVINREGTQTQLVVEYQTATKHNLDAVLSTVNIVAKEQKVGRHERWTHSPQSFLKTHKVMVVAVYVTCSQSINFLSTSMHTGQGPVSLKVWS